MIRNVIYGKRVLGIAVGITVIALLLVGGAIAVRGGNVDYNRSERSINSTIFDTNGVNISINQIQTDSDGDGISDNDEINGFVWNNIIYYTDPLQKSTDFDPYNDYKEITTINMNPTVLSPGRHPLVPSYPDLKVEIGKIAVNTLTKITSTETKESYSTWDINTETVDVTKQNWGTNIEAKAGFSGWTFSPYAEVKASAYFDYAHTLTTTTIGTTSGWNKEEWSMATAVDTDKAARLKYYLKIKNSGTDTAKNVQLRFNVKIGNKIITTITTDKVANRIDPNTVYPTDTFFVIEKDNFGNDITVTLNELKSIELGAPLTIEILEIYAEVPWENEQYKDWSDYKAGIDRTSARIVLDTGSGVKEYRLFSGIRYPASGNSYYFMNVTLENATLYTLGGEQKEDGIYIGGEKVEDWRFGFDNSTFTEVVKHLNKTNGSLLSIPIRQGWTVVMKPPDKQPPKIHWTVYTKDMKGIEASVSDNENVVNVTAHVKTGNTYQNILLKDDDNDLIYNATLTEKIVDVYDDYVSASDGTFISKLKILPIPDIIVDDYLEDDPKNHTWNTIQEGIDNANESDIIFVRNGTYKENIAIFKPLTLIGEDNNNTIIDGENKGDVVYIKAKNVQISGFKIINGRSENPTYKVEIRGEAANGSFTWTPINFGGFWYDVDNDAGNETLKAVVSGRNVYANNLFYTTTPMEVGFGYSPFGTYEAIGFMADKYFAGYIGCPTCITTSNLSTMSYRQLHKVLLDDDAQRVVYAGSTLTLNEGYVLKIKDVSTGAGDALVILTVYKDGNIVEDDIIGKIGQVIRYEKDVGAIKDLPIISLRIETIFRGTESTAVFIKGVFQISESYTSVNTGDRYGRMEVSEVSDNEIKMTNPNYSISLTRYSTIDIMGNMKFKIADSDTLRFYPFIMRYYYWFDPFDYPGSHELRGKVARSATTQTWDAYSFSGFYYDLDQDIKPEKLDISGVSDRTMGTGNLTYQTYSAHKYFNIYKYTGTLVNGQAKYSVTGWQGERYAAVNGKANKTARVLIEHGASASEKKTLTVGETWNMGNGYRLSAQTINAKASPRWARLVFSKDGNILLNKTVQQGEAYIYSTDLSYETNVPVFVTYLDSVFAGATTDMVQLRYTWLMSQDVKEIKNGDEFGKLKVVDANQEKLVLKNNYPFSLNRGSIINIIGDIKFKVADSAELRYYPALIKTIAWEASGIKLDKSENSAISDINILNSTIGVGLYSAINNQLARNNISSDYTSVYLTNSFHNLLINNTLLSGGYGIKPEGYDRIHFNNSIDTSNELNGKPVYYYFNKSNIALDGIDTNHLTLAFSKGFKINNSSIGGDGINLYHSESNTISNNTFGSDGSSLNGLEKFSGIMSYKATDHYNETSSMDYMSYNGSTVSVPVPGSVSGGGGGGGGGGNGISLYYSNYNNIASNNLLSIILDISHGNIVTNNNASIALSSSGNNVIDGNNAFNSSRGIYLWSSSNNSLVQNIVWNNLDSGIFLDTSYNNTLNENNVSNNKNNAIDLQNSNNNTLTGNIMSGNTYNLAVAGESVASYIQKIDTSNIVDGKPVYYLVNQQDQIIDFTSNSGFVGIINSRNITVKDLTLKNNSAGILFINANNSKIENVTLSNNSGGIYLYYSYNNSIISSRASYNYGGIALRVSDYNTFSNNTIFKNGRGISLDSSSNNTIKENYLFDNSEGILINYWCYWCWDSEDTSSNNFIYHNNFINNTQNAIDYSYSDLNLWNAAYPSGGNYWSDYTGIDLKSGEFQDLPGNDGIGDIPYYRGSAAQDRYPFMQLNGWLLQDFIPTISFDKTKVDLSPQFTGTFNLTIDRAPAGLSGYNLTISLSNTSVATILSAEFPGWATLRSNSSLPGGSVWIKAADINELISSGANNVLLATLTIRGDAPGKANFLISVSGMDDDNGTQINPATVASQVEVSAVMSFPCELCKVPTDPDGDGLYEDINGNGRKDFNDVVVFFNYLEWVASNEPISNFDFNGNGRIDFNDIIKLFEDL